MRHTLIEGYSIVVVCAWLPVLHGGFQAFAVDIVVAAVDFVVDFVALYLAFVADFVALHLAFVADFVDFVASASRFHHVEADKE